MKEAEIRRRYRITKSLYYKFTGAYWNPKFGPYNPDLRVTETEKALFLEIYRLHEESRFKIEELFASLIGRAAVREIK